MRSELPAFSQINRRIILDYELLYIEAGTLQLTYNEKDFYCKEGDILLLCPNIPHTFHVLESNLLQPHIHFDLQYDSQSEKVFISFQDYDELSHSEQSLIRENSFPQLQETPILKIPAKDTFLKIFFDIISDKEMNSLNCKAKMLCLLQIIISQYAPESTSANLTNHKIAPLIKSYIDSNYEQEITLSLLERQFDYSKFHIEKLFKQEYGVSVINYRNSKRMAAAIDVLKNNSVSKTAELLGFSSIYSFSRAFRLAHGSSPTKYMQNKKTKL